MFLLIKTGHLLSAEMKFTKKERQYQEKKMNSKKINPQNNG